MELEGEEPQEGSFQGAVLATAEPSRLIHGLIHWLIPRAPVS